MSRRSASNRAGMSGPRAAEEKEELKAWQRCRISQLASSRRAMTILAEGEEAEYKRGSPTARVVVSMATARAAVLAASAAAMNASRAVEKCARGRARASLLGEAACDFSPQRRPASVGEARLYDHFLVVGLPSKLVHHPSVTVPARYSPRVLHHRSSRGDMLEVEAIADFCLPAGAAVRRAEAGRETVEAIFVLSGGGEDGSRVQYGFCAHTVRVHNRVEADCCYCLITQYPFASLHFSALEAAIEADAPWRGASKAAAKRRKGADETMRRYAALAVPAPGDAVRLPLVDGACVEWRRPAAVDGRPRYESTALVREWALPKLLRALSLENVLLVLGAALVELQIVFVSPQLRTLSACALGLVSLLRPLRWAGPLVSALPAKMYEYLESPVPLVLGVVSLPLDFAQGDDMILVFVDEDRVRLPPKLLARPGAHLSIQLPQLSQLAHDLSQDYRAFTADAPDARQHNHAAPPLAAPAPTPASDDTSHFCSDDDDDDDDDAGPGPAAPEPEPSLPPTPPKDEDVMPPRPVSFLGQIQQGATLKKVEPVVRQNSSSSGGAGNALLDAIKAGKPNLRKRDPAQDVKPPPSANPNLGGFSGAVDKIMAIRKQVEVDTDSDDDDDDDEGWDDDDDV